MVAVTSRLFSDNPNLKKITEYQYRCLLSEAKGKTKSNHEVLGFWQRLFRLRLT